MANHEIQPYLKNVVRKSDIIPTVSKAWQLQHQAEKHGWSEGL